LLKHKDFSAPIPPSSLRELKKQSYLSLAAVYKQQKAPAEEAGASWCVAEACWPNPWEPGDQRVLQVK